MKFSHWLVMRQVDYSVSGGVEVSESAPQTDVLGHDCLTIKCMAMSLTIENMRTRKSSLASWSASSAVDWKRYCCLYIAYTTSRTRRWNGSLRMSSSVLFWYRMISRNATVPGLNRLGLRTLPLGLRCMYFLRFPSPVAISLVYLVLLTIVMKIVCDVTASQHV